MSFAAYPIYIPRTHPSRKGLDNVDMSVEKGSITGIIGHTGSGKSTFAQMVNGLLRPTSGKVIVDGQDIWESPKKISALRFKAGLVFQYPEYQLFEETVYKDIAFGPQNMGLSADEVARRVSDSAEFAGLSREMLEKSPFELSGGQRRRAAIAGVMAMDPDILILDEPAAGLDPRGREEILGGITEYQKIKGTTLLIISHSMEDIALYTDQIYVFNKSKPYMYGTPEEIFAHARELREVGLSIPQITKLFLELGARGLPVNTGVHTVSQAQDEILRLNGEKKKCSRI
ncbi:MAG: energy-coupling factor transporter ATPase [Eubacteriales bacterium]